MTRPRIPISGPWITEREIRYVTDAVTRAWYGSANEFHDRFEAAFAAFVGTRFAVCLPSCTSAIHLSLLALGVGPGDEVIVPDVTWIATAAPITYVGATPVFADVDPDTWCLTAAALADCVTPRTKAVIPVDLYGGVPDWDALRRVAAERGLSVIEDAAEAIGSEHGGKRAGSFGDTGVFSFHGSKTLTTGEGGMLVTDDAAVHERVLFLRDHGRLPGDRFFRNTEVAYKYKMSALQAALGLAQLERADELVARKRQIFAWYRERLSRLAGVTLNAEPPGTRGTFWMVTAVLDPALGRRKEEVMEALSALDIDSRPFFNPLSSLDAYRDHPQALTARERNHVAYRLSPRAINLPSALSLTEDDVDYVSRCFTRILGDRAR